MTKKRLAQHILECFARGDVSVKSEKSYLDDYGHGGVIFSICSYRLYDRDQISGYNNYRTSEIPLGSWILYQPFRVGWFWNRNWKVRCEKWNGKTFELVTGFTQEEIDNLADCWVWNSQYLIEGEKQSIREFRHDTSDKTAWYP